MAKEECICKGTGVYYEDGSNAAKMCIKHLKKKKQEDKK